MNTEEVLRVHREYPDRIIPFCVVDPRRTKALEELQRYVDKGARGLGEFKVRLPLDDARSMKIYKACGELGLPVLIHTDHTYNYGIERVEAVIRKLLDTIFIFHGPGWWKHISAEVGKEDYPKGKVVPGGLIERVLSRYSNVYADISAYSGLNALERDRDYAKEFLRRFHDRIIFGTDFPCIAPNGTQFGPNRAHLKLLKSLKLDREVLNDILFRNASKLIRL